MIPYPKYEQLRLFIDGRWLDGEHTTDLRDVFRGNVVGEVHHASHTQVDMALASLVQHREKCQLLPYERFRILAAASELVQARFDEFVEAMVAETGFVVADARRDVERTIQTLLLSGEEAKRIAGHVVPVDADPTAPQRVAFTVRRPVGVVCAITPFNSPLNTVAHKVAPAIAAGNSVVLKPALATPFSAHLLVRTLLDAGLPPHLIAMVHGRGNEVGDWLLESSIPAFYAFTGSTAVGRHLLGAIGVRRAQVELGSLSSTFVCEDANVQAAALACLNGAFRKAGQVCTSVQRLYVHDAVVDEFLTILAAMISERHSGDPRDPSTFIGPLINTKEADRVQAWISAAAASGADIVTGGERTGNVISPTVLTRVRPDMDVMCREVFGPVVSVRPYSSMDEALAEANDTPYGLTAGVFTDKIWRALEFAKRLEVGTIHINASSSSRLDLMPFGGIKASGYGKEGPKYAIQEMTDEVLITLGGENR